MGWEIICLVGTSPLFISTYQHLHQRHLIQLFNSSMRHQKGVSPISLLLAIAIKPLSVFLKSPTIFTRISCLDTEFKVSLYADDLLLYVSCPIHCISTMFSSVQRFGSFSGYKMNISKSKYYPINASTSQLTQSGIPFKLSLFIFKWGSM